MKRVVLFLITNLAVILVLGVILNVLMAVFGISSRSTGGMLLIAFVFGMGGSFISLFMSKWMALRSVGAQVIESPSNSTEQWLVDTVARQAQQAGIPMPEVAIYDGPEMNAFATGRNKANSVVAVSTGLMQQMNQDEVEAVLAHEVSHIANGDMVTLALVQGVVNTFVIFMARVVGGIIDSALTDEEEGETEGGFAYFIIVMVLEIIFGILASTIVMWFSRQREYRADAGGASLASREKMIAALERLRTAHEPANMPAEMAAFGISSSKGGGLTALLQSHPPLEERIEALRNGR